MKRVWMMCFMLVIVFVLVGCNNVNKVGNFYTLKEAYDKSLLSKDDLENIAYYYNELEISDFNPKPKNPDVIDKKAEKIIKKYI